jgi:uncharacterized membrane protein
VSVGSADDGGLAAQTPRTKIRVESLSDLVFGLALSIGSLILVDRGVQSAESLEVNVLLFGFGFLIIIMVWLRYSRTMAVLPVDVPFVLLTNLALLFLVALEPYLFYVLWSVPTPGLSDSASAAYALDLGGMFFMQAVLAYLVVKEEKVGLHGQRPPRPAVRRRFLRAARMNAILGVVFVVSALPFFWVDTQVGPLRYYLWVAIFLLSITTLSFEGRRAKDR